MNPFGAQPRRRQFLQAATLLSPAAWAVDNRQLVFPRDAGAHPDYPTEWWYLTGYANVDGRDAAFGYQLTFFRRRVPQTQAMQSGLAAKQLIFAHAAVTDVRSKRLWHDQRIARSSGREPGSNPVDLASASLQDTALVLGDWSLQRQGLELVARMRGADFAIDLRCTATQGRLLQGDQGLSRKGPEPTQTSYYYSLPQLQVQGELAEQGKRHRLDTGSTAWLDHEWSRDMLHPSAVGWDWIGINFFDGSALTAFQVRDKTGAALWDGGSLRAGGELRPFSRGDCQWRPLRHWRSQASQTVYPVEWAVRIRSRNNTETQFEAYTVKTLVDDQELDSRATTGAIYWEGLCELLDAKRRVVGRGYLEMTGYASPMKM